MLTVRAIRRFVSPLLVLAAMTSCAPYQFGPQSLYSPDITTVYVPVFESGSYRRHLGERLTEAVVKEIEKRTPFKVVASPAADSILYGRIVDETKNPLVEANTDEPRELALRFYIQVSWVNRKGQIVRQANTPIEPEVLALHADSNLVPEVGDSMATAQHRAIKKLASRIVDLMESPWTIPDGADVAPSLGPIPGLPGESIPPRFNSQELPVPARP